MKNINKKILYYLHQIQDLTIETEKVNIYYQADIHLVSVYSLKKHTKGYEYHKNVYIDGFLADESNVIKELRQIIKDLEAMKNESGSKNKFIS